MVRSSNRQRFIAVCAMFSLLAVAGYANNREVIDFAGSGTVNAGQNLSAQISDNQAGMSVTFTSNPPGLVSYTTTVPGTSATVSIPTNSWASGSYSVIATPTGGGVSKTFPVVAQSL